MENKTTSHKASATPTFKDFRNLMIFLQSPNLGATEAYEILNAVNSHAEAIELLEKISIELHRKLISGGMETYVAESLGLDELLIDIENLIAKTQGGEV